ncbi:MAG: 4Fe-4S binding protein, partial [Planctomycetota bacterium]
IKADLCIGCKFCLMACQFGVISVSRDGKAVVKCDLCVDRTTTGAQPACVEACPTKALKLADEKELAADKRKLAAGEAALSAQQNNYKQKQKENKQ